MKFIIKCLIMFCFLLNGFLSSAYAKNLASCSDDVNQMRAEIVRYGYIVTVNGKAIENVDNPRQTDLYICEASSFKNDGRSDKFFCTLRWERGEWEKTFYCK